jgi:hypothetical protein
MQNSPKPMKEKIMLQRNDVVALYRLIFGREPESEDVVNEKRRCDSAADVGFGMLACDEFLRKNLKVVTRVIL